jgi:hypothetical protein
LVLLHLPPLGGQDCNRLMLVTLWLLVGVVAAHIVPVVVVLVALERERYL